MARVLTNSELVSGKPPLQPAECISTRPSGAGPWIDTGCDARNGDRVYIGPTLLEEIASAVELRPVAEVVELTAALRSSEEQRVLAEKEVGAAIANAAKYRRKLDDATARAESAEANIAILERKMADAERIASALAADAAREGAAI